MLILMGKKVSQFYAKNFVYLNLWPAFVNLVLVVYVSSECSDEPVQMHSLVRAFTACTSN